MPLNLVIFSLAPWNITYGCNIKDLSLEFSKHHKVLYIDVPLKRKERWLKGSNPIVQEAKNRIRSRNLLTKLSENLWHYTPEEILESVNSVKNDRIFDTINSVNNKRFAKSIRKAVKAVGFEDYILINDNNIYDGFLLKELASPSLYVYYLRDKLSAMKYWKLHVPRLEPTLIAGMHLVVANSEYLADYAREFNAHSYYVGQGCDVTQFLKKPDPAAIAETFREIPKPIVGYVGALNAERLDIPLIEQIATGLPDHSFVFVGPEDQVFESSKLHDLKNVYFLGKKEFSELPLYMNGFDVAINPQCLNEITIGNYPRKVDEYLATGKPVVATETKAMNPFRDHVYLCRNAEDYIKAIPLAIAENDGTREQGRRAFACEHTWKNNADRIIEAIEKVKNERG